MYGNAKLNVKLLLYNQIPNIYLASSKSRWHKISEPTNGKKLLNIYKALSKFKHAQKILNHINS